MGAVEFAALMLAGLGPLLALARLLRLPATLMLFAVGAAVGLLPGPAPVSVDPELVIWLLLPPVIYAGSVRVTPHLLRFAFLPGVLVGAAVALAIILGVAAALHFVLMPGLSWPAAILVGVVAALFDTRLFHEAEGRPHVPREVEDALKAREMTARVVALATLGLVLDALTDGGAPAPATATLGLLWSILGGAACGFAIGHAVTWLRDRAGPAPIEIAVSLAAPYLGALAAHELDLALAVVVIAAALVVSSRRVDSETGEARSSAEARIAAMAFWEEASLIASSILFFLAGLALPEALASLGGWPGWQAAGAAACVLAIAMALQWLGSLAGTRLPPLRHALEGTGSARAASVMAWASTQSALGLVVALSAPPASADGEPFAERGLVLVVASLVILGSVVVQGLTLRAAVRRAALGGGEAAKAEEHRARHAAAEARHAAPAEDHDSESLAAERRVLMALRERDEIGDEALRRLLREADLRRRAAEGNAMTGAGPPQP